MPSLEQKLLTLNPDSFSRSNSFTNFESLIIDFLKHNLVPSFNQLKMYLPECLRLGNEKQPEFDDTLVKLLNIFEVISIDIKNQIIDEEISYDYLGWFYTAYYMFSKDFITRRRKDAGDDMRVLMNYTQLAEKWTKRMQDEFIKMKGI
jgi:hypothetical protein